MNMTQQTGNEMKQDEAYEVIKELTHALACMCDHFFLQREDEWKGVEIYEMANDAFLKGDAFLEILQESKQ